MTHPTPLQRALHLARAIANSVVEAELLIGLPRVAAEFGYAHRALREPGRVLQIIGADAEMIALAHYRLRDIIVHVVAVVGAADANVSANSELWREVLLLALNVPDEPEQPTNVIDLEKRRIAAG